jgi:hypothetical protein
VMWGHTGVCSIPGYAESPMRPAGGRHAWLGFSDTGVCGQHTPVCGESR